MLKLTKEEIYVLVEKEDKGASYLEIANNVGLSKSRIRDIYQTAKRKQKIINLPDDPNKITFSEYSAKHLSPGTYTALYRAGIKTYHDFMDASPHDLFIIHGIGIERINEIMSLRELIEANVKE